MAELNVSGLEADQRLQWPLVEGEVVRVGRAPRFGFQIPWDQKISREQADLVWNSGLLQVTCLDTARNLVLQGGTHFKELTVSAGQAFQIGDTTFIVSDGTEPQSDAFREYAFGRDELKQLEFGDPPHQMHVLSRLPQLIAASRTDEDLARQLVALLLEAIPRAAAVAVARYDDLATIDQGRPAVMYWEGRTEKFVFTPSRRLIRAALAQGKPMLHIWKQDETGGHKYTASGDLDWAICTPLAGEAASGWCLYVSGGSAFVIADSLKGDVRFTDLMAQFISSIRQVRQLRKRQAMMSQFFSPAVVETLSIEGSPDLLAPKESDISVLFCDVRGFSGMAEQSADNLLGFLDCVSQALGIMTREIVKYDGIVADFQGDAALGFWGWPVPLDEGPLPACQAALAILAGFREVAAMPDHPLSLFRVGIGIAHGRGVAGMIGSQEQSKVGVFGPVVNLGARLESLTRQLGVTIIIDETTAAQVRKSLPPTYARCRRLGQVQPYGMSQTVTISELLPPANAPGVSDQDVAAFEAAVRSVEAGDWTQARQLLEQLPPHDGPRVFLQSYMATHGNQPPANWNGVLQLQK